MAPLQFSFDDIGFVSFTRKRETCSTCLREMKGNHELDRGRTAARFSFSNGSLKNIYNASVAQSKHFELNHLSINIWKILMRKPVVSSSCMRRFQQVSQLSFGTPCMHARIFSSAVFRNEYSHIIDTGINSKSKQVAFGLYLASKTQTWGCPINQYQIKLSNVTNDKEL